MYAALKENKEAIENEIGCKLEWNELPNKKASRIIAHRHSVNFNDKSEKREVDDADEQEEQENAGTEVLKDEDFNDEVLEDEEEEQE